MLGFFSAKPDHPLADAKEARRVLNELPAQEPAAAIDSATAWFESLVATVEFKPERRLELIFQIDEAVLPQTRRLAREYLTSPRQTRSQEYRLWQLSRGYWAELAAAYEDSLSRLRAGEKGVEALKPQLAMLCARLLHAYGGRLKWDQFRYGPVDSGVWQAAGTAYLDTAAAGLAQKAVTLFGGETNPEAEYLKLLLFQSSSMDNLLPIEIEIAERLIAFLLPSFALTAEVRPDNVYWVDAAKPLPPTRLAKLPEVTPTLRFFATASALDAVAGLRARIDATGNLPAEINFGGQYSPRVVLPVLDHLAACWAPKPPMRSHVRHRVKSRLAVVNGLAAIRGRLVGVPAPVDAESWVVEDVSLGGFGAQVPLTSNDWLRVGSLVGMQPEGGDNWLVGVVRRFVRESASLGSVGIETLSKTPVSIAADSGGLATDGILLDPLAADAEVRVVLPAAAWEEKIPLLLALGDRRARLHPLAQLESGAEFVLGRYRAELLS